MKSKQNKDEHDGLKADLAVWLSKPEKPAGVLTITSFGWSGKNENSI